MYVVVKLTPIWSLCMAREGLDQLFGNAAFDRRAWPATGSRVSKSDVSHIHLHNEWVSHIGSVSTSSKE